MLLVAYQVPMVLILYFLQLPQLAVALVGQVQVMVAQVALVVEEVLLAPLEQVVLLHQQDKEITVEMVLLLSMAAVVVALVALAVMLHQVLRERLELVYHLA
jgi:uncharacterized membrane protein